MTPAPAPHAFTDFVDTYKKMALANGVAWHVPADSIGRIPTKHRWDFCALTGAPKPPSFQLSELGTLQPVLDLINSDRALADLTPLAPTILSADWQDLLKAVTVRALFERRNGAGHTYNGICRPIRALATCCLGKEPWDITGEDVARALAITGRVDRNAKMRSLVEAQLVLIDANALSLHVPLLTGRLKSARRSKQHTVEVRRSLEERRRADRIPGADEFWEMLRILLEEKPETRFDAVRFCATEICVLMGLRAEEAATVPSDPIVLKEHFDFKGRRPSLSGGRDHTMFLRHFSEKQGLRSPESVIYAETSTSVFDKFESEISGVVARAERLTLPLRTRLARQVRTGRIFPELDPEAIVPLTDIYPRLTGNPFVFESPENDALTARYRESLDIEILEEIRAHQAQLSLERAPLTMAVRVYFARPENTWIPKIDVRTLRTVPRGTRMDYVGVRVSELEAAVRENLPTKLSDVEPFPLDEGRFLQTNDCLFLVPKRALGEGRNGGVCDVTRYAFVGRLTAADIGDALGAQLGAKTSFFAKYGRDGCTTFRLTPHSLRHMHNNELFLAGVSDTIITNRFGRRSVAQSHDYDSRTLAQELAAMDLPEGSADLLLGPARDVFKLISAGRASGPIVDEFKRIQREEGDESAITFLAAEADGMQITPYGLCLNSFVVEPCPRHLECFNGCCHLMRTGVAAETTQLEKLAHRLRTLLAALAEHPASDTAKAKAREQAEKRLAAVERALSTDPGERVFPNGQDLSNPRKHESFGSLR